MQRTKYLPLILLVCGMVGSIGRSAASQTVHDEAQLRRPAALATAGERLYVANRNSGSVSVVDWRRREVIGEYRVGERLEDLALHPGGQRMLVADSGADRLLLLARSGDRLDVVGTTPVAAAPVDVQIAADGSFCAVASLWARRVTLFDLDSTTTTGGPEAPLTVRAEIDLPFAPRLQWLAPEGRRLVVADAFGGHLAAIDAECGRVLAIHSLEGHNLRGVAASPDGRELLVSHQILREAVPTTRDRVFWGSVMSNVVRSVPLDDLFAVDGQQTLGDVSRVYDLSRWSLHPLGRPGSATGDPGAIALTGDGKAAVALSGVGEVAFRAAPLQPFSRLPVGRRPVAIVVDEDEGRAAVANMFDDSLSFLDLEEGRTVQTLPLGPQPELSEAERGEIMFYDARFSLDGWYSCHSCHTDGHTNGLLNDNFSDDSIGAPKRILSLLGVGETGPWAWNGSQHSLHEQVRKSIAVTMRDHQQEHAAKENVAALTAYLHTLRPPPSLAEARGEVDEAKAAKGREVFHAQGCADCHRPPTYTSPDVYDVNIHDEQGASQFNPPSLRGVSQREAFFHDNRAAALGEVLLKYKHGDADQLPREDREALLAFLQSL